MGPLALLDLIGLDTAYEILDTMYKQGRDRLHAPAPILKQMVTAGLLGRKTGRGFYTYEAPGQLQVSCADDLTPSADDEPQLRRDITPVGVVGTGTMAAGIVEVFAKAGYDVLYVGRAADKVDGVRATIERSLDKAIQRGKLEESAREEVLGRLTGTTSLDDLAGRRHRGRGDRRGPARSRPRCSRTSTRSASPARSWPPRPRRCRSSRAPRRPSGRRTSSACTSSTRRRS